MHTMLFSFLWSLLWISLFPLPLSLSTTCVTSYQTNTAKNVLDTIQGIQPKDSGGGSGETREAVVYRLAEEMLGKLPPDYIPFEVSADSFVKALFRGRYCWANCYRTKYRLMSVFTLLF
ncbi:dynein heavy chain 8, axonemal [Elysia marginata]|uniref:Dynein heavy chain 8, axonemal n=1 Tax=Elysia marginata TaxID=1093978 RepID=A0AAV4ES86_9GAST|nr:dynein heavy chain 8, axonemal [Elysia marginata]